MIYFNTERLPVNDIFIAPETYHHRYKLAKERFDNLINYVDSWDICRSVIIEEYFGATDATDCGECDICLSKRRQAKDTAKDNDLAITIYNMVKANRLCVRDIVSQINGDDNAVIAAIDKLLRYGKISITESGKVEINE
jgi:ATP-dependent DNA helicase RecQ